MGSGTFLHANAGTSTDADSAQAAVGLLFDARCKLLAQMSVTALEFVRVYNGWVFSEE